MKKISKSIIAIFFICSGLYAGNLINVKAGGPGGGDPCEFCHYGQGCKDTTLQNTCDAGPPCSNNQEACGGGSN